MRPLAAARVASLIGDTARSSGLLGTATAYHIASGGRGWRTDLALDCCAALDVPWQDAAALAAACELVHQASIVHDDVQDGTAVRRGHPSVAARYGAAMAICVGDQLLAGAFGVLADLPNPAALIRLFAARVSEMVAGQASEFASELWTDMTVQRYGCLAGGKAGAAVALPIEGAALLSGLPEAAVSRAGRAGRALGMAYQAGDDVTDVAVDLCRGGLNGVLAHALDVVPVARRQELLAMLARGRQSQLGAREAYEVATRLRPQADQLTAWAVGLLVEIDHDMADHRLGPVLAVAVTELRSWLAVRTQADGDAA